MTVRPAEPRDAGAVAEIWNAIIRLTPTTFTSVEKPVTDVLRILTEADAAFVAESDRGIRGFAYFGPFRSGDGYARTKELTIYLAPEARGAGYGRELMEAVEAAARDSGVTTLIAAISGENADVTSFFARFGFREVARLPEVGWKFDRAMDLIVMSRRLS